jgi:hypothetical protein
VEAPEVLVEWLDEIGVGQQVEESAREFIADAFGDLNIVLNGVFEFVEEASSLVPISVLGERLTHPRCEGQPDAEWFNQCAASLLSYSCLLVVQTHSRRPGKRNFDLAEALRSFGHGRTSD